MNDDIEILEDNEKFNNNVEILEDIPSNNPNNKKSTKKIIILILIMLLIIGILGYYLYNNGIIFSSNENSEDNNQNTSEITNDINLKYNIEKEDKMDNNVRNLYNIINKVHLSLSNYKDYFYQGKYISYQSLENAEKNAITAYTLNPIKRKFNKTFLANTKGSNWIDDILSDSIDLDYINTFKYDEFTERYKIIFGKNNSVNFTSFEYGSESCGIDSVTNSFNCIVEEGGWLGDAHIYTKFIGADEENDEYIIYDKMAYCDLSLNYDNKYECYNKFDYRSTEDYDNENKQDILIDNIEINTKDDELNMTSNYPKDFDDWAQIYKHTFKKNSDGTYYWYSTEPINK